MNAHAPRFLVTTAPAPGAGAVAVVQLQGGSLAAELAALTGRTQWTMGRAVLADLAGLDQGLVVWMGDGPAGWAQIFPHGSARVVEQLVQWGLARGWVAEEISSPGAGSHGEGTTISDFGFRISDLPGAVARGIYPEASCELEAQALATVARAASSRAVELLLGQTAWWRDWARRALIEEPSAAEVAQLLARAGVYERLVTAARVVVIGRPNVGKSTLSNRLWGRAASLVADLPGTTRDWVAGRVELGGVAVQWADTPGLRTSADPIEQQAIAAAAVVVEQADVLIALRDPTTDWPVLEELPREPDLWVVNKSDLMPTAQRAARVAALMRAVVRALPETGIALRWVSATTGEGLDELETAILERLGLAKVAETARAVTQQPAPTAALTAASIQSQPVGWAFSATLRELLVRRDWAGLARHAGVDAGHVPS